MRGSWAAAFRAVTRARERGLPATVNTTLTPAALPALEDMFEAICDAGAQTWQVGINVAMGRAADEPGGLLQPHALLELMPRLAALARAGQASGLLLMPGNTVGYFGPDEALLRFGGDPRRHFTGCNAGRNGLGLESDGTLKACPSLPRADYAAGDVRTRSIATMWREADAIRFLRTRTVDDLWGFCRACVHAADCLAGCSWVGHSFLGRPGNNPYCHHRAIELARRGLRERIERVAAPPGVDGPRGSEAARILGGVWTGRATSGRLSVFPVPVASTSERSSRSPSCAVTKVLRDPRQAGGADARGAVRAVHRTARRAGRPRHIASSDMSAQSGLPSQT